MLGKGGMGVVYAARNSMTGREVAIKLLLADPSDEGARQRFLREAHAAAAIRHPNVVDVLDVAVDPALGTFIVMELLAGESLEALLARAGRLPWNEVADILSPIAQALEMAHGAGVIHRDLKPSNIFLHTDPLGRRVPKLVDFGIARTEGPRMTNTGAMIGTFGYMAPEQMSDTKRADRRSDVWSLAVVVYECLAGALPFAGNTPMEIATNVIAGNLAPLDRAAPWAPPPVVGAVHHALRSNPDLRPPTVAAFAGEIGLLQPPPGAFVAPRSVQPPAAPGRRFPLLAAVAITAVFGSGAGLLVVWARGASSTAQRSAVPAAPRLAPMARTPLPDLEMRAIAAGRATIGGTADDASAARSWCAEEWDNARCPAAEFDRGTPPSTVTVRAFELARHEVTNAEFYAWLTGKTHLRVDTRGRDGHEAANGSGAENGAGAALWVADAEGPLAALAGAASAHAGLVLRGDQLAVRPGYAQRPAVAVMRRAALEFCADAHMRLPTAAEWEWAARGADGRKYPWGDALFTCHRTVAARDQGLACFKDASGPATVVDPLQDSTPSGITGLAGNVAEWVSDTAPAAWQVRGSDCDREDCFMVKGGDWASPGWLSRAASVRAASATFAADWLGWRCAAETP